VLKEKTEEAEEHVQVSEASLKEIEDKM